MLNVKILVCTHKQDYVYKDDIYMPIQVGKAISNIDLGFQGDNTGDNISKKNKEYCELTAMYWAWKNLKDIDYIGLCHYRRYFDFTNNHFLIWDYKNITPFEFENSKSYQIDFETLKKYDVILPMSRPLSQAAIDNHIWNETFIDYCILEKVILTLYPEYRKSLEYVFYHKQNVPQRNMFIMKWEFYDKYCEWLFSILFKTEEYVKLSSYTYYQRVFGFMGELLLPLYCYHNGLKSKQKRLLFISDKAINRKIYRNILSCMSSKIRFPLNTIRKKCLYSELMSNVLKQEFSDL